jgi:hypothetical protein
VDEKRDKGIVRVEATSSSDGQGNVTLDVAAQKCFLNPNELFSHLKCLEKIAAFIFVIEPHARPHWRLLPV